MRLEFDLLPGHTGGISQRMADGTSLPVKEGDTSGPTAVAYRATCTCGWAGSGDHPPTQEGRWAASSDWAAHMRPLWAATPPDWLLNRSDSLRDSVAELVPTWPLQALGVLAELERWQKPMMERAVAAAREAGTSWAEIGAVLGITRQSAHQRFRNSP